jgi:aspartyl protease family protein
MRSLLFASIAIALLAVSAPKLVAHYVGRSPAVASLDGPAPETGRAHASARRQVEIESGRDGHFYVDAEINFGRMRLMVDTGASAVALRQSDAAAAGIRPLAAEFDRPVQTANGTTYAAAAELESVRVHDIEVNGVRALILPDDVLSVSLLGATFLNRLDRFQIEDGTLIFEN